MSTPTSEPRPEVGRLAPGVAVSVKQVNGMAKPFTLHAHAWLVLGLIGAALFGLRAFGDAGSFDAARTRLVEVRADGTLLAKEAALIRRS